MKLVVTAAVTGGGDPSRSPFIPVTPEEIAGAAVEACEAGAAIVHLHVRDDDGRPCLDAARYRRTIELIREACDVVVNVSTTPLGDSSWEDCASCLDLDAELASFAGGSVNLGDEVAVVSRPFQHRLASAMKQHDVRPEFAVFHEGMIAACTVIAEEWFAGLPPVFLFVMGYPGGMRADLESLVRSVRLLPAGAVWAVAGEGAAGLRLALSAIAEGGHVRVGLEDQLEIGTGELATSSADLVRQVAGVASAYGRELADAGETRALLALRDGGRS